MGKAAPASDFAYGLSEDGQGVVIQKYRGKGGALVIPAEIEGLPVVKLYDTAFYAAGWYDPAYNITSVVIPASVKLIGRSCFMGLEKLTSVTFLGTGVALGFQAFRGCTNLTELVFPDDEKALIRGGSDTFYRCRKLPLAMRAKLRLMGFDEP
ncbi:MAG: leucine-rich repeat domain-containing protein [Spirochaetaceae bacterium]|nr:leucine-rich repeat domain-containing protein [Spirochaetaceae bacterium]